MAPVEGRHLATVEQVSLSPSLFLASSRSFSLLLSPSLFLSQSLPLSLCLSLSLSLPHVHVHVYVCICGVGVKAVKEGATARTGRAGEEGGWGRLFL